MIRCIIVVMAALSFSAPALAHPHVWVTMQSEVVYAPDGSVTGVRHAWTFDDMFSAFATQGMTQKTKGVFTREELAPLAEVNVSSLKEYGYFNFALADGHKIKFVDPTDYWLEFTNATLVLHFMLPLKEPAKAKNLVFEIYDPEYFVAFELDKKKPVQLAGAPAGCTVAVRGPQELSLGQAKRLSELDASTPNLGDKLGDSFANKITVTCP